MVESVCIEKEHLFLRINYIYFRFLYVWNVLRQGQIFKIELSSGIWGPLFLEHDLGLQHPNPPPPKKIANPNFILFLFSALVPLVKT